MARLKKCLSAITDGRDGLEMKLVKTRPIFCLFVLFCFHFIVCLFFQVFMTAHTYVSHQKNIISKCYLHDIFFIPLLDCKTVRISTRARAVKQKVWNETCALRARTTLTPCFTDFFTDFEKKTDCFAVDTFTGGFRVCLNELIYNLSTEFT